MTESSETAPWICHVCGKKSKEGEGKACALCYKIACAAHLKPVPLKNEAFGHLELKPVCTACARDAEGRQEVD